LNPWQITRQLRHLLRAAVWPAGDPVFGSVHVTNMDFESYLGTVFGHLPAGAIRVGDDVADGQNPDYLSYRADFEYAVAVAGDLRGEFTLTGGARSAGSTSSKGRGVLEVKEYVDSTVQKLLETSGIKSLGYREKDSGTKMLEKMGWVTVRMASIVGKCASARYYHPPLRVVGAGGVGTATLTWGDPPDRYDRTTAARIRIRRAVGATPPATVTDGSQVADVAIGVQTYANAIAAGTYSYSLFSGYDETGGGSLERFSDGTASEDGVTAVSVVVT
jgi:hypothetical protein